MRKKGKSRYYIKYVWLPAVWPYPIFNTSFLYHSNLKDILCVIESQNVLWLEILPKQLRLGAQMGGELFTDLSKDLNDERYLDEQIEVLVDLLTKRGINPSMPREWIASC